MVSWKKCQLCNLWCREVFQSCEQQGVAISLSFDAVGIVIIGPGW